MRNLLFGGLATVLLGVATAPQANAQAISEQSPPAFNGVGSQIQYPSGSRIYSNGSIQTSGGTVIYPNVAVPRGNGVTTYYYPNGTRIDLPRGSTNPSGRFLTPNTVNGGLRSAPRYNQYGPLNRSTGSGLNRNR